MIFGNQFSKSNPMVWRRHSLEGENPWFGKQFFEGLFRKHCKAIYHGFWGKSVFSNEKSHEFRKIT